MKFLEDHFDEYLAAFRRFNLHPNLTSLYAKYPASKMPNTILYGPPGVGKYTQSLVAIKKYSPSELKYEKRMLITFNKDPVYIKMSDIHFEVNMAMLGCNSKLLWNEIYTQIIDVVAARPSMHGIIMCKNFHNIHGELLDVFYSYIRCNNPRIHISFVIVTDNISFISSNIVNCCEIIHVKRPSAAAYKRCLASFLSIPLGHDNTAAANTNAPTSQRQFVIGADTLSLITNIKSLRTNRTYNAIDAANGVMDKDTAISPAHTIICSRILDSVLNPDTIVFLEFRDLLYDILICDIDIYNCIWHILNGILQHIKCSCDGAVDHRVITDIMTNTYNFLHLYNNNYRPIYHLERFMFMLINHVRAIQQIKKQHQINTPPPQQQEQEQQQQEQAE